MSADTFQRLKVVLINLERSADRRATMQARLSAIPLGFEWLRGIDGKAKWTEIEQQLDQSAFDRNVGRPALPGEVGCYLSHLQAWQALLSSDAEVLLVLEDDVVFHEDFMTALGLALAHRDAWDFLKLNHIRAKQPIRQRAVGPYSLNAYLGPATGLGAYLIQRHTIENLLPRMLPIRRPIDHELDRIHEHDFRHYGLEPFPSHVDDGDVSTITGRAFADVRKRPWYARLPSYGGRLATLIGKLLYLHRHRRLYRMWTKPGTPSR